MSHSRCCPHSHPQLTQEESPEVREHYTSGCTTHCPRNPLPAHPTAHTTHCSHMHSDCRDTPRYWQSFTDAKQILELGDTQTDVTCTGMYTNTPRHGDTGTMRKMHGTSFPNLSSSAAIASL